MTSSIKIVKYVRSPFGNFIKWLFIIFNILMLLWLGSYWITVGEAVNNSDAAISAGAAIGSAIGTGLVLGIWVLGDIILGISMLLSRGTRYEYNQGEGQEFEEAEKKRKKKGWIITGIVVLIFIGLSNLGKESANTDSSSSSVGKNTSDNLQLEKNSIETEVTPGEQWVVDIDKSAMDDSTSVTMVVESDEVHTYHGFSKEKSALILRCKENKTDVIINVGTMIDIQRDSNFNSYGTARIRYDSDEAIKSNFDLSSDNEAFFFRKPVDAIKKMLAYKKLTVEFQPYGEGLYTSTFNISDLDKKIQPLRDACMW